MDRLSVGMNSLSMNSSSEHYYEDPALLLRHRPMSSFSPGDRSDAYDSSHTSSRNSSRRSRGRSQSTTRKSQESVELKSAKSLVALVGNQPSVSPDEQPPSLIDATDMLQIELSLKSHKTFVYVCKCMANLYFTKTDLANGGRVSLPRSHEWELARTGVPVIIFDKGDTRSRDKRQLQVALAERGTGFPLWKDVVDHLTDYKILVSSFHTLYLSTDHRKMAGLSFDEPEAAEEFARQMELITSDPLNISLSNPKTKRSKSLTKGQAKRSKSKSRPPLRKYDISSPCQFEHVTSVDLSDFDRFHSISSSITVRGRQLPELSVSVPYSRSTIYTTPLIGPALSTSSPSPVASSSSSSENSSNLSC
ncbi:hypothetical protein HDE_00592 [Halotydeus destructor]|nr:hypothetical protein HDE_00592 [Halotydeus destructor]